MRLHRSPKYLLKRIIFNVMKRFYLQYTMIAITFARDCMYVRWSGISSPLTHQSHTLHAWRTRHFLLCSCYYSLTTQQSIVDARPCKLYTSPHADHLYIRYIVFTVSQKSLSSWDGSVVLYRYRPMSVYNSLLLCIGGL